MVFIIPHHPVKTSNNRHTLVSEFKMMIYGHNDMLLTKANRKRTAIHTDTDEQGRGYSNT